MEAQQVSSAKPNNKEVELVTNNDKSNEQKEVVEEDTIKKEDNDQDMLGNMKVVLNNNIKKKSFRHLLIDEKTSLKDIVNCRYIIYFMIANIIALFFAYIVIMILGKHILQVKPCIIERTNPNKIQYYPMAYCIVKWIIRCTVAWPMTLMIGRSLYWSYKQMGIFLIFLFLCFLTNIIPALIYEESYRSIASVIVLIVLTTICLLLFHLSSGYLGFWIFFPVILTLSIIMGIVMYVQFVFWEGILNNDSWWFGYFYSAFISLIEYFILRGMTLLIIPFKWKTCFTCPYRKTLSSKELKKEKEIMLIAEQYNKQENDKLISTNENLTYKIGVNVIDFLDDKTLLYLFITVNSFLESMKLSAVILMFYEGTTGQVIVNIIWIITREIMARNNLYYELFFDFKKICCKNSCNCLGTKNRYWGRLYAIYNSSKLQSEYLPLFLVLCMNLFQYGPFKDCDSKTLFDTINLNGDFRIIGILLLVELSCDILSEIVLKIGRCCKCFGVKDKNGLDLPRKLIHVRLDFIALCMALQQAYAISYMALNIEANIKHK